MMAKIRGWAALAYSFGHWFFHESLKHLFFEQFLHLAKPYGETMFEKIAVYGFDYGIPLLVAILGFYWLHKGQIKKPLSTLASTQPADNPPTPPTVIVGEKNIVSHGQSGGMTAGIIYNVTPTTLVPPLAPNRREISELQRRRFIQEASLDEGTHHSISIRLNDGSNEGRAYLNALLALFASTPGWTASSQGEMVNILTHFAGLRIDVGDITQIPAAIQILQRAFNDAGIIFEISRGPASWSPSDFRIVIGTKP